MAAVIYGTTIYKDGDIDFDVKGQSYNKFYSE